MRLSWRIGRIAGIDVFVHATFLAVFFLFPRVFKSESLDASDDLNALLLNVLLILSVFGCVLLHELGHALMARRFGIETHDITLYPIGGVARLARMPRAPCAELLIALAGPAVNFAIALVLFPLLTLGGADLVTSGPTLGDFLTQVLFVNLGLVLFNLIPAFPMDGGRVLRALLSGWLGRVQATVVAARVGRVLAISFGTIALMWTGNPIHIALAAFVYLAARAEEAQVLHEDRAHANGGGIWTAPSGYRWVSRGNGLWQLAPITVRVVDPHQTGSPWR
jgi:Zn-dependent protease